MTTSRVQHRINPILRRDAEAILKAQGIKPAQAIVLFYTEVTRSGGLPFHPTPVRPSEVPNSRLRKQLRDADNGKGLRTFTTERELFESLHDLKR